MLPKVPFMRLEGPAKGVIVRDEACRAVAPVDIRAARARPRRAGTHCLCYDEPLERALETLAQTRERGGVRRGQQPFRGNRPVPGCCTRRRGATLRGEPHFWRGKTPGEIGSSDRAPSHGANSCTHPSAEIGWRNRGIAKGGVKKDEKNMLA